MKNMKWNYLVYVHAVLLLWAVAFICCLVVPGGGSVASVLAIGNIFFLFVNIPLAIFSFILKAKDRFGIDYEGPIAVLSVLNSIIGAIAWTLFILLMQSPKFG